MQCLKSAPILVGSQSKYALLIVYNFLAWYVKVNHPYSLFQRSYKISIYIIPSHPQSKRPRLICALHIYSDLSLILMRLCAK